MMMIQIMSTSTKLYLKSQLLNHPQKIYNGPSLKLSIKAQKLIFPMCLRTYRLLLPVHTSSGSKFHFLTTKYLEILIVSSDFSDNTVPSIYSLDWIKAKYKQCLAQLQYCYNSLQYCFQCIYKHTTIISPSALYITLENSFPYRLSQSCYSLVIAKAKKI